MDGSYNIGTDHIRASAIHCHALDLQFDRLFNADSSSATPTGRRFNIGVVTDRDPPMVILKTIVGTHRILDLLSGEQLPRICWAVKPPLVTARIPTVLLWLSPLAELSSLGLTVALQL